MIDWPAVGVVASILAMIVAFAIGYGVLRNKVANLQSQVDAQDDKIEKLASVAGKVDLLDQHLKDANALLRSQLDGSAALITEKMESVRGEVRSFMQGQASMGGLRPGGSRGGAKQG